MPNKCMTSAIKRLFGIAMHPESEFTNDILRGYSLVFRIVLLLRASFD